ncbi:MAG: Very-short-patch mismatch repair endonuclease (G-T specific) [uncultured Thiotrichaceae bacterium]|uniref:Very short patch repair endonuclease n=1 Tax=uncultured Thiotrichaceae bacterium TaxID=298394 RepID=A0A6S6S5X3_9GAMM|nr:MAG: Very-short-patch mismatch repair endonuclease (G-T specific) [uncultured Thiotrichaceae bacterium]
MMVDIVSKKKRSEMMSGIKSKDTKPEILIRKALFARGFRYRIHDKKLPGKPDLVLAKYRVVIFVHGCFWHGHDCHLFKVPQTRTEFWLKKINSNKVRDQDVIQQLLACGWRVLVVWECSIRGKYSMNIHQLVDRIEEWMLFDSRFSEISWGGGIKEQ